MNVSVRVGTPAAIAADLTVVAVPETSGRLPAMLKELDQAAAGEVARAVTAEDFLGKRDETLTFRPATGPKRVVLVGIGDGGATPGALRRAAAIGARQAIDRGAATVAFAWIPGRGRKPDPAAVARAAAEGVAQGSWFFDDLRSEPKNKGPVKRLLVVATEKDKAAATRGAKVGAGIAAGHLLARKLQMLPGNHCPPRHLAKVARDLGRRHGHKVTVLNKAQMEKLGMNAHLAVSQGSAENPCVITLEYRGGKGAPICLVGKGVTFDSGGISIKPAASMEEMKFDMSGAAAVLGTFEALGRLKPKINVVGVVPATENLPSATAVKPGDVVTSHLGKTVEIINTDAEGRLILCDALSYARKFKPACMLDIATLTGAIVIGLGHFATGVMGNNDELVEELRGAGDAVDERCWPLPLWEQYRELIKSTTADIKNIGGRAAGSITAGWFLREFVDDEMPWAHLDIAGTAWGDGDEAMAKGPTGVGVRLFSQFILDRAG